MKTQILVFDVESTSLFGEAFAVGGIVGDFKGNILDEFALVSEESLIKAGKWVVDNVFPNLAGTPICRTDLELRTSFFTWYLKHKETCSIWSDVNFPVETNFLADIVNDDPVNREFMMPYPLHDVSAFVPISIDRIVSCGIPRLRKHNPFDDAKASFYCLLNTVKDKKLENIIIKVINDGK